ncbi:hypothetical protein WJ41_13910 [Burkholderia ubonensis]|nr:hypothetical protein WJ41_13910 [Burkholderia ubonensis]
MQALFFVIIYEPRDIEEEQSCTASKEADHTVNKDHAPSYYSKLSSDFQDAIESWRLVMSANGLHRWALMD